MNQKGFANIVLVVVIIILAGAAGYFTLVKKSEPKICTEEARVCPDGTTVGRVPPTCEFTACPTVTPTPKDETVNWKTYTNTRYGFEFKYPKEWLVFERKLEEPETLLLLQIGPADLDKILSSSASFPPVEILITSEALESIRERSRKTAEKYNSKVIENPLIFAGHKAFQFANELTDKNDKQYYISFGNNVYIIRTMEANQENVRHIFSTFKFTN